MLSHTGTHRTRRALTALLGGLALALAQVSDVGAQAREEEKVNIAITGDITALDAEKRTLTIKSTNDEGVSYQVDGSASIMKGSQKLELGDLKTGWNVVVNGHRTGDTRLLTFIKVVKAP
jgi:hypothetical protein